MKKRIKAGFNEYIDDLLRNDRKFLKDYAREVAKLPLPLQLAMLRGRRGLTQEVVALRMRVKQPQVARMERDNYDPRLSSVVAQARAIGCHLMLVPDESASLVREKADHPEVGLRRIKRQTKGRPR
jgi:DNA-binding XRE family transcriptional regulator